MKRLTKLVCALILCAVLPFGITVFASDEHVNTTFDDTEDALSRADELIENFSFSRLGTQIAKGFKDAFFGYRKTFASLLFVTVLSGIINSICSNKSAYFASEILLCSSTFSIISTVIDNVSSFMEALESFILSVTPIMTTIYTASSAPVTAAASYGTTMLILNICSAVFSKILLPSVKVLTVLATISLISRSVDMSGFARFVRSTIMRGFGITMCIMSAGIYFQSVLGIAKDGIASRAIRYVASSVIPVIGGVVSESARTVSEGMRLVRSVGGSAGVFAIIGLVSAPLAAIAVCSFFMRVCSATARLTGGVGICNYYDELCGILDLVLGASIGVALVFILILGIFAKITISV